MADKETKFKLTKKAIRRMYADDVSIKREFNLTSSATNSVQNATFDSVKSTYFGATSDLSNVRNLSNSSYLFYPIYSTIIDYLSNMFL